MAIQAEGTERVTPEVSAKLAIQPAKKLNPAALEFIGSTSTSEASRASSQRSDAGSEEESNTCAIDTSMDSSFRTGEQRQLQGQYQDPRHLESQRRDRNVAYRSSSAGSNGWESPQGVLPPSHPFLSGPQGMQGYPNAAAEDLPPGDANLMRSSSPPPPGYMMYPVYSHHHDRAASPPPVYGPSGGSPPLGPGFISVPLRGGSPPLPHHTAPMMYHGHEMSPPPSLGSSPPGNPQYFYLHPSQMPSHSPYGVLPTHPHAEHFGPIDNSAVEFISHQMSNTSIGSSQSSRSTEQQGPTRASARIARSHRAGGAYNPAEFEFNLTEAEEGGQNARTTVMIRNIPNKYNQTLMVKMLEDCGFAGKFDFFYLPIDFRNRCGLGYAFVNMLSSSDAADLYKAFHNKRWDECISKKVCQITYARVQGRDNLVQHFKASKFPSDDAQYQPLVYSLETSTAPAAPKAVNPKSIHEFISQSMSKAAEELEDREVAELDDK